MTLEEMKKFDKKISSIPEPFGKGFPSLQHVFYEMSVKKDIAEDAVLREYLIWKKSKR